MRSIRVFCNFLAREGLVDVSPFEGVEIPRVPEAYPKVLSEAEITKLIKVCKGSSWLDVRNRAILLTFLDTGIRLSELVQLDLADVNLGAFSLRIRRGKGGKERHVFMGRTLFRAMRRWLDARGYTSFQGALFVTRKGTRIDRRNVQRTIERIARRAGLNGTRVTPHLLRHTFATHYIKNGGDPFSLQRILGHSDIKTTMIYVNLAGASLREAHARASPVDRLV
jgi:site-specific recombinase XerD